MDADGDCNEEPDESLNGGPHFEILESHRVDFDLVQTEGNFEYPDHLIVLIRADRQRVNRLAEEREDLEGEDLEDVHCEGCPRVYLKYRPPVFH